jgi:aerobic carbon-monoxide dehydrogenase large subunit
MSERLDGRNGARVWKGRYEDDPLLRGEGRYGDDVRPEGAAFAAFVRSPHAFAEIASVDAEAARTSPGVVAVITAEDLAEFDFDTVSRSIPLPGRGGAMPISPFRPVLAKDRVVHIGQAVALVVAETAAAAQDAADLVSVDYAPLDAMVDVASAKAGPAIWPEAPGNVALDWTSDPKGEGRAGLEEAFARAAHISRIEVVNQRLAAVSLEPRVATASYDDGSGHYTLRCGTQGVAGVRGQVAACMRIEPTRLRVLTDDVGGGFGMKASTYPEYPALLAAAKLTGRSVHWTSTRAEAFLSDNQGRDSIWTVELALDADGRFLGLRVDGAQNTGAFLTGVAVLIPTFHIAHCLPGYYDIPHVVVDAKVYLTNTVPTGPYRGAGRPEANYLLERVVDTAAREIGIDPVALRRRNLIAADRIPYKTATGPVYDSGDFPTVFEKAVAGADYAGLAERREEARHRGKLRGIGVACYLEIAGGHLEEPAAVTFPGGDTVRVSIGPAMNGQGHQTVFREVVADRLGIPEDCVEISRGDSARDVPGFGAVASRTAMLVGGAVAVTLDEMLGKAKGVAATLLQASPDEMEYRAGRFEIARTGAQVSLFEVAKRAVEMAARGALPESLDTKSSVKTPPSFPNGCHVAEVEVDPDTGHVEVVRYTAVDDCGVVLNETIVEAQIHGGVAQGLGQALGEHVVYEPGTGQVLSGSFMDYYMPRADSVPSMQVMHQGTRCTTNPLGTKGTGEAGTTAAPAALVNAVENAIGAKHPLQLDMPLTPQKVWRALQDPEGPLPQVSGA